MNSDWFSDKNFPGGIISWWKLNIDSQDALCSRVLFMKTCTFAAMIDFSVLLRAAPIIPEVLWLRSSCSSLCVNILTGNLISMIMSLQIYNLLNRFLSLSLSFFSAASSVAAVDRNQWKAETNTAKVSFCSLGWILNKCWFMISEGITASFCGQNTKSEKWLRPLHWSATGGRFSFVHITMQIQLNFVPKLKYTRNPSTASVSSGAVSLER